MASKQFQNLLMGEMSVLNQSIDTYPIQNRSQREKKTGNQIYSDLIKL